MLILPPGHGRATGHRRAWTRRERLMVGGVLGAIAVLIVVLAVAIGTAGKSSGHGCIYATLPGPVGAEEVDQCGAQARATCQSVGAPGTYAAQAARVIAGQCRKAGLPVGR